MDKSIVHISFKFLAHGLNHGLWNNIPNKTVETVLFGILQLWRWIKNMQNLEYHFVWHLFMQPYFFQNKPLGMTITWSLILFFLSFYFITHFELNQKARKKEKKMDKSIVHISAHFFTFSPGFKDFLKKCKRWFVVSYVFGKPKTTEFSRN